MYLHQNTSGRAVIDMLLGSVLVLVLLVLQCITICFRIVLRDSLAKSSRIALFMTTRHRCGNTRCRERGEKREFSSKLGRAPVLLVVVLSANKWHHSPVTVKQEWKWITHLLMLRRLTQEASLKNFAQGAASPFAWWRLKRSLLFPSLV